MRRLGPASSILLFVVVYVAVAEACLLAMVLAFTSVLHAAIGIEVGSRVIGMYPPSPWVVAATRVSIATAGTAASWLFTLAFGLAAAALQFRRWRPAP